MHLCIAAKRQAASRGNGAGTMNSLIRRKGRSAYRHEDPDPLERAMPRALVALNGVRHGQAVDSKLSATADARVPVAAVDAKVRSLVWARGAQRPSRGTDPLRPTGAKTFVSDPAFVVPVIASSQEIRYAQELREQLKRKYLDQPSLLCSPWCVDVD